MAALSTGSIPAFYSEFYDAICPTSSSKIPKPLWMKVVISGHVAESTAEEIWNICDPSKSQQIGRDQLYKSLALLGLIQKGKPLDEKVLLNYGDKELPVPSLVPTSEVRDICSRFIRATNPTELGYSYDELKSLDDIKVTLLPEKKGTLLNRHNEYNIESRHFGSSVSRRYNDFVGFHQVILARYPYRLIPSLPPKALFGQSDEFIEQRRRCLKRYLTLICRHPTLIRDDVVRYFFTTVGQDVGARIKEKYKNTLDEFTFHPQADTAGDLVTSQHRMKYERIKEQISLMLKIMNSLLLVGQNMESRTQAFSEDMQTCAHELNSLSNEAVLTTPWTSSRDDTWDRMRSDFRQIVPHFNTLATKAKIQAEDEANGFFEGVSLFIDHLAAYQELCLRREKFVHTKHQKALSKVKTMEKYKGHLEAQGKAMSSQQENKLAKNDDELAILEKRNFFSLFCLDLEAQLIHVNLSQLPEMLQVLVDSQMSGHQNYYKLWEDMKPLVDAMSSSSHTNLSSTRPRVLSPDPTSDSSPFS